MRRDLNEHYGLMLKGAVECGEARFDHAADVYKLLCAMPPETPFVHLVYSNNVYGGVDGIRLTWTWKGYPVLCIWRYRPESVVKGYPADFWSVRQFGRGRHGDPISPVHIKGETFTEDMQSAVLESLGL